VLPKLSRYEQRIERSMYRAIQELRRLKKRSLPEGEWIDPEEEEAAEWAAEGERMRETKPTGEYSENGRLAEKDGEEESEDEDEEERPRRKRRTRKTKPTGEYSENRRLTEAEEGGEEGEFEDEDEGTEDEDEGDRGASAREEMALGRETKPTAENSDNIMLAPPLPEPPPGPIDPFQEARDRIHGRKPRRQPQTAAPQTPAPVDPFQELRDRIHRRKPRSPQTAAPQAQPAPVDPFQEARARIHGRKRRR